MTREQLQTIANLVAIAHDEYDGCPSYRDDLERFDRVLAEIKAEAQSAPGNAPTRNCDRFGTAFEAEEAWMVYPPSPCRGYRVCPNGHFMTFAEWLFAPAAQ